MGRVLVVGSANADLSICAACFPSPGETVRGSNFTSGCGGKGANQAAACALSGADTRFVACVGNDVFGEKILTNLSSCGVDCSGVGKAASSTGVAVITVSGGDNSIVIDAGANALLTPDELNARENLFDGADYVLSQFEIPYSSVVQAARLAKKHGAKFVFNPAPFQVLSAELMLLTDIIILNEHEVSDLTGIEVNTAEDAELAARQLTKRIPTVIITLGKQGSVLVQGEKTHFCPAFEVEAVDSTGAGDCFTGSFLAALCNGETALSAVRTASAAAAISVTRRGAAESFPTKAETAVFLSK